MSGMEDTIIHCTKDGEQNVSTILWIGGYALSASACYITAFIVLLLGHIARRVAAKDKKGRWRVTDWAIQYASLPAIIAMAYAFIFIGTASLLVYGGWFGPANMVSLHVDPAASSITDLSKWFVQNSLPKQGHLNFFPWYFPVFTGLFSIAFVSMAAAYFNRLETESALTFFTAGVVIAILNFLSFVSANTVGWYLFVIGSTLVAIFNTVMLIAYSEAGGKGVWFASTFPLGYHILQVVLVCTGSYSAHLYYTDVTFIWMAVGFPIFCLAFSAFYIWGGAWVYKTSHPVPTSGLSGFKLGAPVDSANTSNNLSALNFIVPLN